MILISNHHNFSQSIKIYKSLISFNKVAFGGIFSFKINIFFSGKFKLNLTENSFQSNSAAYKGGLFYFDFSEIKSLLDKGFSDYFSFHFKNNRINNNWAPQGSFAYFEFFRG